MVGTRTGLLDLVYVCGFVCVCVVCVTDFQPGQNVAVPTRSVLDVPRSDAADSAAGIMLI